MVDPASSKALPSLRPVPEAEEATKIIGPILALVVVYVYFVAKDGALFLENAGPPHEHAR